MREGFQAEIDDLRQMVAKLQVQTQVQQETISKQEGDLAELRISVDWLLQQSDEVVRAHVAVPRKGLAILLEHLRALNAPRALGRFKELSLFYAWCIFFVLYLFHLRDARKKEIRKPSGFFFFR